MNNWSKYKISELCEIKVSGVDKKIYPSEIPVKLCNYMDAYRNDYLSNKTNYSIGSVNHNELRRFSLNKNDVIITKDSETPEDIAVSSVVVEDLENVVCGYHLAILQPNEKIDGTFLMHSLKLPSNQRLFYKIASGSTRYGLTIGGIESVELSIPPVSHQQKIAKILSTCDIVISQTEQAIKKYQAIKQGMMTDLFTRGIDVNTGKLRPSYEEQPDLYKESELGWVPKDWKIKKISEGSITYSGGTPNRSNPSFYNGTVPWVSSGEVNQPFIFKTKEYITERALKLSSAKMVNKDSVLIAMYGATAGQVSMLKIDACTNQAVLAICNDESWNNYFLYHTLNFIKGRIIYLAQGSGQPNLSKNLIDNIKVCKPDTTEQDAIAQRLNSIDSRIQAERETLKKYQQITAGLMQDLLTGKVQVQTEGVA